MPRTQRYEHIIRKTRKEHICGGCKEIIKKGSSVTYKNNFDGTKTYFHSLTYICDENIKRNKKHCHHEGGKCTDFTKSCVQCDEYYSDNKKS